MDSSKADASKILFGVEFTESRVRASPSLESAYLTEKAKLEKMKKSVSVAQFGAAFPMKMELDRQIMWKFQRPLGSIPSSFLGLEAMLGGLEGFGFEDYLNDLRESKSLRPS